MEAKRDIAILINTIKVGNKEQIKSSFDVAMVNNLKEKVEPIKLKISKTLFKENKDDR